MARVWASVLQLVKSRDHVIVKHIVIIDRHQVGKTTDEQTLDPTYVWQQVEEGEAFALDYYLVQIHLDGDIQLDIIVFFVWDCWLFLKSENRSVLKLCEFIEINVFIL